MRFNHETTALVLVDLINRIVDSTLAPRTGREVVQTATLLADSFRRAGALVVVVRVERPNVAEQPPGSGLVRGVARDGDVVLVKRTIGAFEGTGLREELRQRAIDTIVLAGIATNLGVESTARAAVDCGFDVAFVEDAMAAITAEEHTAAITYDFPRLGHVVAAADISVA